MDWNKAKCGEQGHEKKTNKQTSGFAAPVSSALRGYARVARKTARAQGIYIWRDAKIVAEKP